MESKPLLTQVLLTFYVGIVYFLRYIQAQISLTNNRTLCSVRELFIVSFYYIYMDFTTIHKFIKF